MSHDGLTRNGLSLRTKAQCDVVPEPQRHRHQLFCFDSASEARVRSNREDLTLQTFYARVPSQERDVREKSNLRPFGI